MLKNAVDVLLRPFGVRALVGKPESVVSASTGAKGEFGGAIIVGNLCCLGVSVMANPEAHASNVADLFDDDGILTNTGTIEFLKKFTPRSLHG